jgi:hypothetical protein
MILHGLVHGLYFGQSARLFELQPGMVWPDGSWAFSKNFEEKAVRALASLLFLLAGLGFIAGGIFALAGQAIWRPAVMVSCLYSSLIYILFWDGKFSKLHDMGGIGILINIAIFFALIMF